MHASRALINTEQIALTTMWACERFAEYLIGKDFHVDTDHKPLVPLLGSKCLEKLPPRMQHTASYTISHGPGKSIATAAADMLCRAPVRNTADSIQEKEVNLYVNLVSENLPAIESRLKEQLGGSSESNIATPIKCQKIF